MSTLNNRSELVFLYDIKDANPNGDPMDQDKPRMDEENSINLVTDVRLKRTIRDYLFDYKGYDGSDGKDIFVREKEVENGEGLQDGKARAKDFQDNPEKVLQQCIDVRLFGGVIPLSGDSITYTGPVQFQMGRSLHPVEMKFIKGTGAFASQEGQSQRTFREEYVVSYSLIGFYGIINENAGKKTNLTEEDVDLLLEGMWKGTKNLITRSKMGQTPRLLLQAEYSEDNFFIGELKEYIELESEKREDEIRDVSDYRLDVTSLKDILAQHESRIEKVHYKISPRLNLVCRGKEFDPSEDELFEEISW